MWIFSCYTNGIITFGRNFMNNSFSDRISDVPRSFIREILKVALDPAVISFAGGLPNRDLFPAEEIKEATSKVFDIYQKACLRLENI
jgi:2-aminoadipate transaminase